MAMSDDPFIKHLSRFTPAAGLDRYALLFAAGRASARPNRRWQALAGALAACQLLTLGLLLWPRPASPDTPPTPFVAPVPDVPPLPVPATETPALLVLRERAIATEGNLPLTSATETLVPTEPPLRAFGPLPAALLKSLLFSQGDQP